MEISSAPAALRPKQTALFCFVFFVLLLILCLFRDTMSGHPTIPAWLQSGMTSLLRGFPARQLRQTSRDLLQRLRAGGGTPPEYSAAEVCAYVAARLPSTYGAVRKVLEEHSLLPSPAAAGPRGRSLQRILDFGAGPGSASLAVLDALHPVEEVSAARSTFVPPATSCQAASTEAEEQTVPLATQGEALKSPSVRLRQIDLVEPRATMQTAASHLLHAHPAVQTGLTRASMLHFLPPKNLHFSLDRVREKSSNAVVGGIGLSQAALASISAGIAGVASHPEGGQLPAFVAGGGDFYDLAIMSYVLSEMDPLFASSAVPDMRTPSGSPAAEESRDPLWKETLLAIFRDHLSSAGGFLLLIEPGTPQGFSHIRKARSLLIESFAPLGQLSIIGPCPHMEACPMAGSPHKSWCHFSARLERPDIQRSVKQDQRQLLEDERYSYLLVQKKSSSVSADTSRKVSQRRRAGSADVPDSLPLPLPLPSFGRVLRPPMKRTGHVVMDVCRPEGQISRMVLAKSLGRENGYAWARKTARWGSSVPFAQASSESVSHLHTAHRPKSEETDMKQDRDVGRGSEQMGRRQRRTSKRWTMEELDKLSEDSVC